MNERGASPPITVFTLDLLLALPRGPRARLLVRLPIAALALHRAIRNTSTAVAAFQSIDDLRLRFGAEMARFEAET